MLLLTLFLTICGGIDTPVNPTISMTITYSCEQAETHNTAMYGAPSCASSSRIVFNVTPLESQETIRAKTITAKLC